MSGDTPDDPAPVGSRVTLIAHGREVTVEAVAGIDEVSAQAFKLWTWMGAAGDPRPRVEAGGMGFEVERADGPAYADDAPGTVRR